MSWLKQAGREIGRSREVIIDYTNYRGERRERVIEPVAIFWGNTEHHPEYQWLLIAKDVVKGERRTFAMKDIHSWK